MGDSSCIGRRRTKPPPSRYQRLIAIPVNGYNMSQEPRKYPMLDCARPGANVLKRAEDGRSAQVRPLLNLLLGKRLGRRLLPWEFPSFLPASRHRPQGRERLGNESYSRHTSAGVSGLGQAVGARSALGRNMVGSAAPAAYRGFGIVRRSRAIFARISFEKAEVSCF